MRRIRVDWEGAKPIPIPLRVLVVVVVLGWLFMWRITADAWIKGGIAAGVVASITTLAVGAVLFTGVREMWKGQ